MLRSYSFNVCDPVGGCGANLPSAACKTTSIGGMETAIGNPNTPAVHRLSKSLSASAHTALLTARLCAAAMADVNWINQQTGHQPPYTMQNGGLGIKMVYPGMPSYGAAGVTDEHVTVFIPCDSGALFAHPLKYVQVRHRPAPCQPCVPNGSLAVVARGWGAADCWGGWQGAKFESAVDGFLFVLPSIHGCPTNKALPDMGDPLSFGWVFIILFLVVGAVYCGGGLAYKMHTLGVRQFQR